MHEINDSNPLVLALVAGLKVRLHTISDVTRNQWKAALLMVGGNDIEDESSPIEFFATGIPSFEAIGGAGAAYELISRGRRHIDKEVRSVVPAAREILQKHKELDTTLLLRLANARAAIYDCSVVSKSDMLAAYAALTEKAYSRNVQRSEDE